MNSFRMRPISESELDEVIFTAGGLRAHPDANTRTKRGADYVLGNAIIEFKALNEEGLEKTERQAKLAALFRPLSPPRPVIVLDRNVLCKEDQHRFDRILEGPIKREVASARTQLKQSRVEFPSADTSLLWIVNNGYSTVDFDSLAELVERRVRNDTSQIDGVIVSGCYFYSDTFDSYVLWPIRYIAIKQDCSFDAFDQLRAAWHALAFKHMKALVQERPGKAETKDPVADMQFDVDGITYVKPTPPMGSKSDFFVNGRPRLNSSGLTTCPPVATTFADFSRIEWKRFRMQFGSPPWLCNSYADWSTRRARAERTCRLKPLVTIPIKLDDWIERRKLRPEDAEFSAHQFANEVFTIEMRLLIDRARERTESTTLPARYILVVTEEIGQDRANDISHIAEINALPDREEQVDEIELNRRMFHEHALATACAYAMARKIEVVLWQKDQRYAWW